MQLRRLQIQSFRGIKQLDWKPHGKFICLIGAGDSTKTTLLDAIELALLPRWSVTLDDSDFHDGNTDSAIEIIVTVSDLPERLLKDSAYGLEIRGVSPSGDIHDEPDDEDEPALEVRFRVDASLEPTWSVMSQLHPEGRRISTTDRELLGLSRLGASPDRHLAWGLGSALSRLDPGWRVGISGALAGASRAARAAFKPESLEAFSKAASSAQKLASALGVVARKKFAPHLDIRALSPGSASIALHDGDVPLRRAGLGTRRLIGLALQRETASAGGLSLIDEIEHGLEPHRLRHVLRVLRSDTAQGDSGQVVVATHSAIVVTEVLASELVIVRADSGNTRAFAVPGELQAVVRSSAEAMLAPRILVCEGKTEIGLVRAMEGWLSNESAGGLSVHGVGLADGCGSTAPRNAHGLARLGYGVALLADSDVTFKPTLEELQAAGVSVHVWPGKVAVEQRLALDLPWQGVVRMVTLAAEEHGLESVRAAVARELKISEATLPPHDEWPTAAVSDDELRRAIGAAAKGRYKDTKLIGGWFKRVEAAERLGTLVAKYREILAGKATGTTLDLLKAWITNGG